ncbi:MAG: hypothetical protein KDB86_10545, partial [Actinobacteria bacterium]|nr:hypothetical protein [Actinomycetota bacterium]
MSLVFLIQREASAAQLEITKSTLTPMPVNPGDPIKFEISYGCVGITGNCDNATIVDQLPAEFKWADVYVNYSYTAGHIASDSYDPATGQITFTFNNAPLFQAGDSGTIQVFATFDSGIPDGTTVSNEATFSADGQTPVVATADATVSASTDPSMDAWKVSRNISAYQGDEITWELAAINNGAVTIDSWSLEDQFDPAVFDVTQIDIGTWGYLAAPNIEVQLQYETASNPGVLVDALPSPTYLTATQQTVNVADLGLGGDPITRIVLTYNQIPIGFSQTSVDDERPMVHATVLADAAEYENCVSATGIEGGTTFANIGPVCATSYSSDVLIPHLAKEVGDNLLKVGDVTTYYFDVGATAGSIPMDNATLIDLLPVGVTYVAGSWRMEGNATTEPSFEIIDNYNGSGQTALKWDFPDPLPPGEDVRILFDAYIDNNVTVNDAVFNDAALYNTLPPDTVLVTTNCGYSPVDTEWDLNDDGIGAGQQLCVDDAFFSSLDADAAALSSIKWVKGQLDADWTRFPDVGETVAGGYFDYELRVNNVGDDAVENLVYIDILPFVGDQGVLDTEARATEWTPALISEVVATDPNTGLIDPNVTVYYSTVSDICRTELGYDPAGCNDPQWSTTLPALITSVTALKFDFGDTTLNPGDERALTWRMRAPLGTTPGDIAWNSFAYSANTVTNGTSLRAEPFKVGIRVNDPEPAIYGDYVWLDANADGIQDEGSAAGINDVRVDLYDPGPDGVPGGGDDVLVDFTYTSNDSAGNPGYYLFPNLDPGDYFAVFSPPPGYTVSPPNVGGDDSIDSDGVFGTAGYSGWVTEVTQLDATEDDRTWDLGVYQGTPPTTTTTVAPTTTTVAAATTTTVVGPTTTTVAPTTSTTVV